jgi:hypothetical protein
MSIPTTVTLNVGAVPADVVFEQTSTGRLGATELIAPSPQADLEGRPVITVRHRTSKTGLVQSTVTIKVPQYDSGNDTYDGFVQGSISVVRKATHSIAESDRVLEMCEKLLTQVRDEVAAMEY